METQNQEAARSPAEVPNDPGKMFVGGLSWQTSPGTLAGHRPHCPRLARICIRCTGRPRLTARLDSGRQPPLVVI
ncbi:unnamed protein product [Arctia plantaginis]|uniref:Uncharacterized protein n=1 Tax=Arctia plantaginis TaxID=874455 RepID=A0A8S0ZPH3_ARCPL|nr:unnamed protein product [Arctia plantaginis]CAB3241992.1 unnamed protein product [Arctia plantaginis]